MREKTSELKADREKDREDRLKHHEASQHKTGHSAKETEGYVGFANLPNQVYRKAVKRGFDFTLMVVGK